MLFLLVLAAIQQPPAEQQPKEILVELRPSVQQRLPLRMDTQFKQYSDWGGTDVEAGAVFSADARLTLTADAFLLELDLGRGYQGVHILRGCELTRFLSGPDRLHYSKWKFAESECFTCRDIVQPIVSFCGITSHLADYSPLSCRTQWP